MTQKIKNLRGTIIGIGSIGTRHLYNLKKLGVSDLLIVDMNSSQLPKISSDFSVKTTSDIDSSLDFDPDFCLICTWPDSHISLAKKFVKSKKHIFIEKPISNSIQLSKNFLDLSKQKKSKITVGYNMRFEPGLRLLKQKLDSMSIGKPLNILSQWGNNIKNFHHPSKSNHYILQSNLGGVILDASHEYDYVRWLLNDKVTSVYCRVHKSNSIKTETESTASIMLNFKKGTTVNVLLDYMRPKYERSCVILGENGSLKWDFNRGDLKKNYGTKSKSSVTLHNLKNKQRNFSFSGYVNDMYVEEMKNFLKSIVSNSQIMCDGWDGLETLKIGLAALKSSKTNKIVNL